MDNYEAIMKMNRKQLEAFLDNVYCTGLNNGLYAACREEEGEKILDEAPFDKAWLAADAEPATRCEKADDGDDYLLEAFVASALRNTEVDTTLSVKETDNKKTVTVVMSKKKMF